MLSLHRGQAWPLLSGKIGNWEGQPVEFHAGGGIYYYNSAADSTIDFYPREPYTNKNIIFQLPTIDSVSYGGGMIKDWFNTSDGLWMRSTGYPNSYQTIYCSHTSKTSTKGGKRLCWVDYFTLNAEATNRGLIPDGDNVITLEIGGPSPNPNPWYNAPYGLQVNIDAGG